jgi:Trypsin-like peptidase domain
MCSTMEQSGSPGRRGTCAVISAIIIASAATPSIAQWTPERTSAVVRFEVPRPGQSELSIGTGFIVKGLNDRFLVLTVTHVVLPDYAGEPLTGCKPLLNGTKLRQGNDGGAELVGKCVYHLGYDVSLVELGPRDGGYPVLALSARELAKDDVVSLAGFPFGYPRDIRTGKVTLTTGPEDMVVTDIFTAEGMSGGPNLAPDGMVVGIHRGGGRNTSGFAHMMPISRLRTLLESRVPPIPTEKPITSRPDAASEAARNCINTRLEQLRAAREPLSHRHRIECTSDRKTVTDVATYDVRVKKPGYAIADFVSHRDKVKHGSAGMLTYGALDGFNTYVVTVPLACDVSDVAEGGFVEVEFSGSLRRLDTPEVRAEFARDCAAAGK